LSAATNKRDFQCLVTPLLQRFAIAGARRLDRRRSWLIKVGPSLSSMARACSLTLASCGRGQCDCPRDGLADQVVVRVTRCRTVLSLIAACLCLLSGRCVFVRSQATCAFAGVPSGMALLASACCCSDLRLLRFASMFHSVQPVQPSLWDEVLWAMACMSCVALPQKRARLRRPCLLPVILSVPTACRDQCPDVGGSES
jgi:hypothetical protein